MLTFVPVTPASAALLWSTGVPQAATKRTDGTSVIYQLVSGNVDAANPQRYAAVPFHLDQTSQLQQFTAMYTDAESPNGPRSQPSEVGILIWERSDLNAPAGIVRQQSFGAYALGQQYQSVDVKYSNDYLHTHALDFILPAGDYYITLYSPDAPLYWVTGGMQPDAGLEQDFLWRSAQYPDPGFTQYVLPLATDLLSDPKDVYNPIFSISGVPIPEPTSGGLFLIGATAAANFVRRITRRRSDYMHSGGLAPRRHNERRLCSTSNKSSGPARDLWKERQLPDLNVSPSHRANS